MAETEDAGG